MTSILENEIWQQPEALERLLAQGADLRNGISQLRDKFDNVLIAARGTSDNAARYAQYLFGAHNQLSVALATPSLYTLYQQPPKLNRTLVIGISQSGQSPDIVAVLAEGKKQGQPTLAITNNVGSPLAQTADFIFGLQAGAEKAVAATKTYTTSLGALAVLSALLAHDETRWHELQGVPNLMRYTLETLKPILPRVERYRYMDRCAVLGRGYNYATAFEIALKVKELTSVVAEPYSSADFRHGPIAIVRDGFPVIVVAPSGRIAPDMADLVTELKRRKGEIILISDQHQLLSEAQLGLPIPSNTPEWLTPLVTVIPGQCFALRLCEFKGMNVDQPIGLTKVTETL